MDTMTLKQTPYSMVGSGSNRPASYGEETSQTKTGAALINIGAAIALTSTFSNCFWSDQKIDISKFNTGLTQFPSLLLTNKVEIIDKIIDEEKISKLLSIKDQVNMALKQLNPGGMSGLSTLLQVSRPTLYKWTEESSDIKKENQKRLALLVEVAKFWKEKSIEPMRTGMIRRQLPSGTSLFDILKENDISIEEAKAAIILLADSQNRSVNAIDRLQSVIQNNE